MHYRFLMLLAVCLILLADPAYSAQTKMDSKTRADLEAGKIVMSAEKNPKTGVYIPTGQSLIEAPVEDIWRVITDFDGFDEFMPSVVYYKPLGWKEARLIVDCRVKVVLMKMDYTLSYIIDEKNHTTYWFYVKGPIKDAQGFFRVEPYDATRSIVTYTTTLDIGKAMPDFIEQSLGKSTFPSIFKSLKKRVAMLKQKGDIPKPVLPSLEKQI